MSYYYVPPFTDTTQVNSVILENYYFWGKIIITFSVKYCDLGISLFCDVMLPISFLEK